ncbi:MAG: aldehyde dehydrogenase family protein [Limnochordaceae bacterium]|nr:aldehyde dehydrogenase family protein [Limnochordaceae bacterium]
MDFYPMYIGGRWVESRSGQRFSSINPATGEVLGEVAKGGREDAEAAIAAAKEAFDGWRKTPAPRRGEILFRAAELLKERKESIARLMTREMGKVLVEARGDVQEAIDMTYYMAGEGRRLFGETVPSEMPNKFAMAVREAIGVVGVITPWNFPIAIPSWKIMPALISGNTVVFKPASDTPILGYTLVRLLEEAGIPPGVVNLVYGPGSTVGEAILEHPDVPVITFTGSNPAGVHVNTVAAPRLKRVHLELGGKNAIIVMDDADLKLAVEGIVWSAFGTSGQRCTAASRVIVHRAVKDQLLSMLIERIRGLRLGDGLLPETDVGPVINRSSLEKIHSYTEIARLEGASVAVGGEVATEGELSRGFFYKPTLFVDVKPEMRVAQEEIFGPVTSVIQVDSLEEAIAVNNRVSYGLSSSIYTRNVNTAFTAIRDLMTGLVYVNHGTIGSEVHLPFGGMRQTGNGHREAGQAAIDFYTEWKSVYVDFSGKLQRAQIDRPEPQSLARS